MWLWKKRKQWYIVDHCLRKKISDYHLNNKDQIRLTRLQNEHCQSVNHDF